MRKKRTSVRELRELRLLAQAWRPPVLVFGSAPPGSRCAVCRVSFPLAPVRRNYLIAYLCQTHWSWFEQLQMKVFVDSVKSVEQEDPRQLIEHYRAEGVSLADKGCVVVEGYEHLGPAFVTELRSLDGKCQIVCVAATEARGRTPEQFLLLRCRAILHGIRTMLGVTTSGDTYSLEIQPT